MSGQDDKKNFFRHTFYFVQIFAYVLLHILNIYDFVNNLSTNFDH